MKKNIIHNLNESLFYKILLHSIIILVVIVPCFYVNAAGTLENPLKAKSFTELINGILGIMISIGVPIAGLFLVYSGFLFTTATGDPKKLDTAKSAFLWTCVGIALIVGGEVILTILQGTVDSLK
jgi:hypothetical protein